jgi:hypothetical protein
MNQTDIIAAIRNQRNTEIVMLDSDLKDAAKAQRLKTLTASIQKLSRTASVAVVLVPLKR